MFKVATGMDTERKILNGCSGEMPAGDICCIIGPSGAGKTSLLNILAGRVSAPWTGQLLANGVEVNPSVRILSMKF